MMSRRRRLSPHPEEPCAAWRLEGRGRAARLRPSFETRPSDAPQDEVGVWLHPAKSLNIHSLGDEDGVWLQHLNSRRRRRFGDRLARMHVAFEEVEAFPGRLDRVTAGLRHID